MLDLERLLYGAPGLLAAIVLHEFAHAFVADRLGDPTPRRLGRLTLHPGAHLDPIGLLMLVAFGFGWARPVPVNPFFFGDRRRGMLLVALAGPLANVLIALVALLLLQALGPWPGAAGALGRVLWLAALYNVALAVFNILPVPPLDGSRILAGLVPAAQAAWLDQLEQYGWLLLIGLLMTGVIDRVLGPLQHGLLSLLLAMVRGPGA